MKTTNSRHTIEEPIAATIISHRFSHVVWGAIFAGVVTLIVVQLALTLLGSSVGLTIADPQSNNLKAVGIAAVIWWLFSGCVSFFVGGWISGRLSGIPRQADGVIHGIITWSVATIAMFIFLTSTMGVIIAGSFGLLKSGGQAVAQVAPELGPQIAQTVQGVLPQNVAGLGNLSTEIQQTVDQRIRDPQNNANLRAQLMTSIAATANADNPQASKDETVNLLVQNTNLSEAEARSTVDRWSQTLQSLGQDVRQGAQAAGEAAENASDAAGKGAFASFLMLALGALAAGIGGRLGAPHWSEQEIT